MLANVQNRQTDFPLRQPFVWTDCKNAQQLIAGRQIHKITSLIHLTVLIILVCINAPQLNCISF